MASEAAKAIEAILMVAQEPVDPHLLAQVLEVAPARVSELCAELQASYEAEDRGFGCSGQDSPFFFINLLLTGKKTCLCQRFSQLSFPFPRLINPQSLRSQFPF